MTTLPPVTTEDAAITVGRDEAALRPGIERLCHLLNLDASSLGRFGSGSRPVYAAGDLVLKLYPPVAAWPGYQVEAAHSRRPRRSLVRHGRALAREPGLGVTAAGDAGQAGRVRIR